MNDILDSNTPTLPSYMQDDVGDDYNYGAGMEGGGPPRLVFKGSRFRIRQGQDEVVLKETELDVIIMRDYPAVSRIYFASGYDGEGGSRPSCASADGEVPLPDAAEPQSDKCMNCPQNEKGSTLTDDGRKSRACSFYKRLVVMLPGHTDVGLLVADIKAMSLFGESKPDSNQWNLKTYMRRIIGSGRKPYQVITRLTFDTDESVPKVLFSAVAHTAEDIYVNEVVPKIGTPDGRQLLEEMADTSKVRTGDGDDNEVSEMKDRLLNDPKPAYMEGPKEDTPAEPEPEEKELSPQQKAAITRKRNAAKKKAAEEAAAKAAEEKPEQETEPAKTNGAGSELEKALSDLGF